MAVVGARAGCDSPSEVRRKPRVRARREFAVIVSELHPDDAHARDEGAVECDAVPVPLASEMWSLMGMESE